jgi:uncharacterized protein YjiS (DUF1127 family)
MTDTPNTASIAHRAAWPGKPASPEPTSPEPTSPVHASRHSCGLAALRDIVSTWKERRSFRWQLDQMSKTSPHLIDDIGLTSRQVEAEIAKPFWKA